MPSFLSGLVNAGSAAATGALEGQADTFNRVVALKAQRRAEQLKELDTLGRLAGTGLAITPANPANTVSPRDMNGVAPTSPEAGQRRPAPPRTIGVPKVAGPADEDATGGGWGTELPTAPASAASSAPAGPTETPIGEVGGFRVAIPAGGIVDKSLRDAQAKREQGVAARREQLRVFNETLPDGHPHKLTPPQLSVVANDDNLFNKYSEDALGLGAPKNLDPLSEAGIRAATHKTVAEKQALRAAGLDRENIRVLQGVDAEGKPTFVEYNVDTHTGRPIGDLAPKGSTANARETAQLAVATGQATDAHALMTAFENKVLAGQAKLAPEDVALAKSALGGSTLADYVLNKKNPDLAQYARGAKMISGAERMITPRGGSNALMNAETFLSGAGAGATPAQIRQAQAYRARLIEGLGAHGAHPAPHAPAPAPVTAPAPAASRPRNIFLDGGE
jgi:hypothetical protein